MSIDKITYLFEKDRMAGYESRREYAEAYEYYCGKNMEGENVVVSTIDFIIAQKVKSLTTIHMSAVEIDDRIKSKVANQILLNISTMTDFMHEELNCIRDLVISAAVAKVWFDDKDICRITRVPLSSIALDDFLNPTRIHVACSMYKFEIPKVIDLNGLVSDDDPHAPRYRIMESWIKQDDGRWKLFFWQPEGYIYQSTKAYDEQPYVITPQKMSLQGSCYGIFRHIKNIQESINYYEHYQRKMLTDRMIFEIDSVADVSLLKKQVERGDNLIPVKSGSIQNGKIKFLSDKSGVYSDIAKSKKVSASSISGIGFDIFNGLEQRQINQNTLDERSLISELGTAKLFGAVEKFETDLYMKILKFIKNKKNINRYTDATKEEIEEFRKFDNLDLRVKIIPKTQSAQSSMAYWAEIYKATTSVAPELAEYIVELLLSDSDNPKCDAILKKLKERKTQAQQEPQEQTDTEIVELQKQKILAEIEAIKADTAKKMSQADLLQVNTVMGIENQETVKQQQRLIGGGTIDTRS